VRRKRERWAKLRAELSKKGLLRKLRDRLRDKERGWMRSYNHRLSRELVEHAKKYENPMLVLEDLRYIRENSSFKGVHRWNFGQLRDFIKYKATEEGIPVIFVEAKNTSITCSRCGHVEKRNPRGRNFACVRCGYSVNAEVNAAINIARAGLAKISGRI
jgi:IS605 OrfB family transposase